MPSSKYCFTFSSNESSNCAHATFSKILISLDSEPNIIFLTPNSFNKVTLVSANISADWLPNTNGNSITISHPYLSAKLVFSYLDSIDISPRSKK